MTGANNLFRVLNYFNEGVVAQAQESTYFIRGETIFPKWRRSTCYFCMKKNESKNRPMRTEKFWRYF